MIPEIPPQKFVPRRPAVMHEMTLEELQTSGTVVFKHIIADLKNPATVERLGALWKSMVAAWALDAAARKLLAACRQYFESMWILNTQTGRL